jgi:glyoxylase-like metal-dependent hydrolase (beta-lactamase superfamily II)
VFDQLADGVFRRRFESLDLNVGLVFGESAVLVVDTRASHREADELIHEIEAFTSLPVAWLVNTHWHWDHAFGNSRFPGVEIWGHRLCREALIDLGAEMVDEVADMFREDGNDAMADDIKEVVVVPPESVFEDSVTIDLGGRAVELTYHGLAHTDADIVIRLPDCGVTFFGDMLENGAPPNFGDSYPLSWPGTLTAAMSSLDGLIVPGHGEVMTPADAGTQLEELKEVARAANWCLVDKHPVEEMAQRGPYPTEVMMAALSRALEVGGSG